MSQFPPILSLQEADLKKMLACNVHLGSTNLASGMDRYIHNRNEAGNHIIDLRKTWEKITLAARAIVAVENPHDVCVIGLTTGSSAGAPIAQRAVLKFGKYTGARAVAGRFTPGTLTNQIQSNYFEPSFLILSDPIKDRQPLMESSYMNIPVISLANSNHTLRNIDIVIPCNTEAAHSVALVYWLLAREVLRLQGRLPRDQEWDVMVDMFIYKDEKDQEKIEEERKVTGYGQPWSTAEAPEWDNTPTVGEDAFAGEGDWSRNQWDAGSEVPAPDYPSDFNETAGEGW